MPEAYAPGFVIRGWSRGPNGKWVAIGSVPGTTPSDVPPLLTPADIAEELNDLEENIAQCLSR